MSGPKEEPLTAADEIVGQAAAPETPANDRPESEDAVAQEPGGDPGSAVEMSAAEALARATEAAADPTSGSDVQAEPPAQAEPKARAESGEDADGEPAASTDGPDAAMGATDDSAAAPGPQAATEPPAAAAGDEEPERATAPAEPAPSADGEPDTAPEEAAADEGADRETASLPRAEAVADADAETVTPAAAESAPEGTRETVEPAEPAADKPPSAGSEEPAAAAPARPEKTPLPDRPELRPILEALENRQPVEGRVIGWNNGGFHLALGELSAFCPRSEMEVGEIQEPEGYLDGVFMFRILRLQGKGRRIVVSRAAHLRKESSRQRNALRKKLQPGTVLDGTVASLKDFGAFVDLGGAQGLVHVSEISHRRVEHPSHVLSEGQQIQVKVLKVEQGGRRISLSIRALEPDPWKDLADRFPRGAVVKGTVEKANQIGAFIELAPGLTGLLPARSMSIPRETSPARAYPPGKEVSVQIVSVDPRRQRISLAPEGSGLEGSTSDYKEYQRQSRAEEGDGFNALASAFRRLRGGTD